MYTALYRKYRPLVFDDVLSQPHNTITLRNQVRNNTTAHAYLFTGSRGTGKTTCARILAKAVNCENPKDGNPCLECSICKDAENSALSDIIEIDAASNNGVDDIRDLREAAAFMPERCKYRIYIIDEVHMLSPAAFNALLKIMEEPPPYVKFILATTELHKVPATVLSRCQRFDFRRIKNEDIVARIKMIAEKEGTFTVADEAAELIARLSDGGMRDALSLLDQCVAFSSEITSETVSSAAGIAGRDYLFDIMDAVSENDIARIISVTDRLYAMSKDMQRLCAELISQFRNVMLIKTIPGQNDILACMPDEIGRLTDISSRLTLPEIMDKLDILQSTYERLSKAVNKRVELEMCFVRLCTKKQTQTAVSADPRADISDLADRLNKRISALEQSISNGAAAAPQIKRVPILNAEPHTAAAQTQKVPEAEPAKINLNEMTNVASWAEILERYKELCPPAAGCLEGSSARESGSNMVVLTNNLFFAKLFAIKENSDKLRQAAAEITGKQYNIRCFKAKSAAAEETPPAKEIIEKAKRFGIPTELQ